MKTEFDKCMDELAIIKKKLDRMPSRENFALVVLFGFPLVFIIGLIIFVG